MEQLLTENDKKESEKYLNRYFPVGSERYGLARSSFEIACLYKNKQIQEFLKWVDQSGWFVSSTGEQELTFDHVDGDRSLSFSELFEIFEKETTK